MPRRRPKKNHAGNAGQRHRRKLLSAAEAWLFLAERLDELDHVTVAFEVGDDFDTDTTAELETKRACCRLDRGVNDTVATQRLGRPRRRIHGWKRINRQQTSASSRHEKHAPGVDLSACCMPF